MQSELVLPSNRKFGGFFSTLLMLSSITSFLYGMPLTAYALMTVFVLLITITVFSAHYLTPLNRLWMQFGLLLGRIANPLVLGVIFFFVITPLAIIFRLLGRDELLMKQKNVLSYFSKPAEMDIKSRFEDQF